MNLEYTIKNFRTIDKEGAEFNIRPITILTGCNSSGKSSIVKSILVLEKFLSAIKNDNEDKRIKLSSFYNYPMHFNVGHLKLGKFDCVLNRESANERAMTFGYTIESGLAARKFQVEYVFEASKDILNDARLNDIRISTEDGIKVLDKNGLNVLPLRDAFFKKIIYEQQGIFQRRISQVEDIIKIFKKKSDDINKLRLLQTKYDELLTEYDKFTAEFGNELTDHECHCFNSGYAIMSDEESEKNFSVSFESGVSILKIHSLYAMPVLEALASSSKDNFLAELEKVAPAKFKSKAEWTKLAQTIAEDFRTSGYDTFVTYFRDKEEKELSNIIDVEGRDMSLDISIQSFLMDQMDDTIPSDIEPGTVPFKIIAHILYLCSLSDEVFRHRLLSRQDEWGRLMKLFGNDKNLPPVVAAFCEYSEKVIHELLLPPFVSNVSYIGSSRAEIKRLYSVDDRSGAFDNLVVEYENQKRQFVQSDDFEFGFKQFVPGEFINKWLKKFKIADSMSFKNTAEGTGIMIYLHRNKDDVNGHLLADEGYGITQLISILLGIEISIMKSGAGEFAESRNKYYNEYSSATSFLLNAGYPCEMLDRLACPLESTLLIEEPETHLHPKYQSMLAEMFLDAYATYNIQFVIETHSEYLIRKFQTFVAKYDGGRILSGIIRDADSKKSIFNFDGFTKAFLSTMSRDEISVYYLYEKGEQPADEPSVKKLELGEDGRFASQFGPGFFDEADNLAMDLLSTKMQRI